MFEDPSMSDMPATDTAGNEVRPLVERVQAKIKNAIRSRIEVGIAVRTLKDAAPTEDFRSLLKEQFDWDPLKAANLIKLADRFDQGKLERAFNLLSATVVEVFTAPSAPTEAMKTALARANHGDTITEALAKDIVKQVREASRKPSKPRRASGNLLRRALQKWSISWQENKEDFANLLRDFADRMSASTTAGCSRSLVASDADVAHLEGPAPVHPVGMSETDIGRLLE